MARCGCAAGCSCLVVGSSPIVVSGNGAPGSPFTVSISSGGQTGCAGVAACVGQYLGPGLTYDEATGRLQALVSRDAGNALTFGSDSGLFTTGGGGGGEAPCRVSVDSLPAAGVAGAYAMAGLIGPYNSPYQLDYCAANNLDIVHFNVCAASDGVAWVAEYDNGQMSTARSSIFETTAARYLDSATIRTTRNLAGDLHDAASGNGVLLRTVTCGWYGWLSSQYVNWMLPDLLARLEGKSVALADCRDIGEPDNVEADNIQAALRAVRDYCAHEWVMVGIGEVINAGTVLNAGMEPVVIAGRPETGYGTTDLPYTVAELTGAGVAWMALDYYYADSVFAAYVAAGINVLMTGGTRHVHRVRSEGLGCRGFLSLDPVYMRGPAPYDYRRTQDPWSQRRMGVGQLSHISERSSVLGDNVRGYFRHPASGQIGSPEGLMLPARWGNGGGSPALLAGWECPLTNPTSYTISVEMIWDTLPTGATGKMGLLFAMPDDRSTFVWNGSDGNPDDLPIPPRNFYRAFQRVTGPIGIGIYDESAGAYVELATVNTPAMTADVWNTYLLTVTPTTISFRRTTSGGTNYTVSVNNSKWRGPYFAVEKEENHPENAQYGFIGGFRNLVVTGQGDT